MPAPDRTPPRLRLHLSPTTFAVAARAHIAATRKRRVPAGATLTMTISEKGGVRLTIARRVTGRRVGTHCVAPTSRNRGRAPCTRYDPGRMLLFSNLVAGPNRRAFSGRIAGRPLAAGRYRMTGKAVDGALNVSKPQYLDFAVSSAARSPSGRRSRG
jgi:hypothetical protein